MIKKHLLGLIYEMRHELYKIARCRLSCEDDIEDAVQETMIETFRSIKKLKKLESYKKWVIKILINKCNHIYKKNKDRNISFENVEGKTIYQNKYEQLEELDFYSILKGLKYEERMILTLFYLEDYSIKEISKVMKLNENTVKTKLKRGKDKIRINYGKGEE
ncbi:MAG: sigma-70 family RNA polymerase sigma factor [Clostridia bacterium]|nr:sigma-70 family RNA polymerase sigma factor [Clostridia bacterium]